MKTSSGQPRSAAGKAPAKLQRGEVFAEKCPSRIVLAQVTNRWGGLILLALRSGTLRFSELRRKIGGVSEKMLAQNLQRLEQYGFIARHAKPTVPPHVEYSLTALGKEVSHHISVLATLIEDKLPVILSPSKSRQRH